ncbi:hypothetical protein HYV83_04360 [Candidatus Woesearchaeota archaeon]|nr:hypothetical protein [Candidatus Woesearchaeota archaeon]
MEATRSKLDAAGDFIRGNVKKIAAAMVVLLVFSLVFNVSLKTAFVIPLLILAASFSTFYFNYFNAPINFELVKLATIVAAAAYGLVPGLAVGLASTFFGKVLIGRVDEKLPLSMLTISIIAVAAAMFSGSEITALGITLVLAYNVTMFSLSLLMGGDLAWNIPYEATNFLFNVFLFMKLAPLLKQLLA